MFTNYCRIAWRNLTRNKVSSFINILGLAIGMAVTMLNGLWTWDELSFNHNHLNYKKIGQVVTSQVSDGETWVNTSLSYPLANELRTNYRSSFKHVIRTSWPANDVLSSGDKKISGTGIFMDDEAPEMLTLQMRYGSHAGLKDPNNVLLASSLSKALFGDSSPLGETIQLNNKIIVKVAGVYEDLPQNSQFSQYKFIGAFDNWVLQNDWILKETQHDWGNHYMRIYVQIPEGSTFEQASVAVRDLEVRHKNEFKKDGYRNPREFIYPMDQWHLYPYTRGSIDTAAIHLVRLVGMIGGIVLLLACINFMNLSTARAEKRAKEVGIRKTIGSGRRRLVGQFYSESFLVVCFAFGLALLLLVCSLSWFNDLAAKQMSIPWSSPFFWCCCLIFITITGVLAGSYPALYLSSFNPVKVLKGSFRAGRLASIPRKILVVTQFMVSVSLIICTIVVYRQIEYGRNRSVGYTREGLIGMEMKTSDFYDKFDVLRDELKRSGAIVEMSASMGKVTGLWSNNDGFKWRGMNPDLKQNIGTLAVTSTHGATVGWQFTQGRDFKGTMVTDSAGIVMNETAVKYLGLPNPVGETIGWKFWNKDTTINYHVLGVIKDMVMESPFEPVKPTFFFIKSLNGGVNYMNIRLATNIGTAAALEKIGKAFKSIIPSAPFEYKFVDEEYARKFAAEERIGKLAAFFGSLAVFISCLGLFGLAAFVASQRTKEIGVRRVLGASVFQLWQLLSKEFIQLVVLSCLLAIPIAWWCMHAWVQNYTYRTNIAWWIFAATALGALAITLVTVSLQGIRAAMNNQVDSLRSE